MEAPDETDPERVPLTDAGDLKDDSENGHGHSHGHSCSQSHLHHGHSHLPGPDTAGSHTCLLTFTFVANTVLTIAQLTVSIVVSSLALFIDAVDMTADVLGYGLNLLASWYGQQGASRRSVLKLEVVAATASSVSTVGLSIYTMVDAAKRLQNPSDHDMELGGYMLAFSAVGLVLNCISLGLFHKEGLPTSCSGDEGQLNLCSAVLHLAGDTIRMLVILGSGLYIVISGTMQSEMIDAWCAIAVSVFSMSLTVPVFYGIVLTVWALCRDDGDESAD